MAGERQGWQTWDVFKKAGIVAETVDFSDNAVIISHTIGKTKDRIGKCWPMDAAVAYTLAKSGKDAMLKPDEMVNEYTKMAACMMTRKVGWGEVPDPRVKSCNHDMIEAHIYSFLQPKKTNNGHITWQSQHSGSMASWLKENGATKEILALASFRTEQSLNVDNQTAMKILMTPKYTPLRLFIEKVLDSKIWLLNSDRSTTIAMNRKFTTGICKWKDDAKKLCAHHDKPKIKDWVMIRAKNEDGKVTEDSGFMELWSRERHEASVHRGWNNDQVANTLGRGISDRISPSRVVLWSEVSRSFSHMIERHDPKLVVREIKQSLRRMSSRNFNVVRKEGMRNQAKYTWKEWGWLTNMQAWVAQTSKKNRKEGDLVNGWKYVKFNSRRSYGHEIAYFRWQQAEEQKTFSVKVKGGGYYEKVVLPYRFKTKNDAIQFKQFLSMMALKCNAVDKSGRKWNTDKGEDEMGNDSKFSIVSESHTMLMKPEKDPEDLPSPEELLNDIFFSNPQAYEVAVGHLYDHSFKPPQILEKEKEAKVIAQ